MKSLIFILSAFFIFSQPCFSQDNSMLKQKKERKRVWRRWNSKRDGYNPYLKKKNKDKPSVKMARANKREQRRQKRMFRKQTKAGKKQTSR